MEIAILVISVLASIFISIYTLPQLYVTLKTKDTSGLKLSVFSLLFMGAWLFLINGIGLWIYVGLGEGIGLVISNIISGVATTITIGIKIYNMKQAKKNKMTEVQYYESFIKGKKENKVILNFEAWLKKIFKKDQKINKGAK